MDDKIIIYYMMLHKKLHGLIHIKIKKNIESVINNIEKRIIYKYHIKFAFVMRKGLKIIYYSYL